MINRTFTSLAVMGALGILAPMQANAFGLGSIELSSALNEPFLAEIQVTALREDEVGNLQVQLASREEFERAGLIHNFLLTNLKFKIVETAGKTKVVITSTQPVKEPFIDFLLTATTGNGRLIREYTVLLDPPKNVFTRPAVTSAPAPTPAAQVESKPSTSSTTQQPKTTTYQYDSPTSYTTPVTSYGPTDRNDTLWDIALKTRPEQSISVHQMMMALLEENTRAFAHNNINGLKAGYTLSVPSSDVIKQISKKQAISAVGQQNDLWKNRNAPVAPIDTVVSEQQADEITADTPSEMDSSETQEQDLESVSTEVASEDDSRLQLVAPNNETAMVGSELSPMGSSELEAINEQLTLAQETIEGQAQDNIDMQARMSVMEEQIQTLRRLISLKDADLARLQSSLEEEELITEELEEELTEELEQELTEELEQELTEQQIEQQAEVDAYFEQAEDDASTLMPSDEEVLSEDDMQLQQDVGQTDEGPYELTGVPEIDGVINNVDEAIDDVMENVDLSFIPSVDEVVSYTSEMTGVDENEMKSALEKVKTFLAQYKMESLAVGLLLLIVIWLLLRRRNRPDISWDEAVGKLDETTVVTPDDVEQEQEVEISDEIVETSSEIELQAEQISDDIEQQVESEPTTPTKTVEDLIQDADVYVSYGDFEKAKLTLQEAISDEPSNDIVNHKLLFVLFKQQQQNEFIDLASQGQIDKDSFEWAEVVEWGRELAPEHQLFKQEELEQGIESDDLAEFELPVIESDHAEPESEDTLSEVETDDLTISVEQDTSDDDHDDLLAFTSADITSDDQQQESAETDSQAEEETTFDEPLEFNIESDNELTEDDAALNVDITLDDDVPTIEFEGLAEITEADMSEVTKAISTENELEFNLGEFDNIDEAETKLDLASAYIDMGDSAGASSILDEVIKEGNEEQKNRAQAMLKDLS